MSGFYSGTGDDGTTGLLGEGRVSKDHPRPQAFGALDEASAALGVARATTLSEDTARILVRVQRDLYHMMSEVAAHPEHAERFRAVGEENVRWIEQLLTRLAEQVPLPAGFVVPGDSTSGAALDLARTVVRRAERQLVSLSEQVELGNPHLLSYLNRLSSLCFALALRENQLAGVDSPTMAKGEEPRPTGDKRGAQGPRAAGGEPRD